MQRIKFCKSTITRKQLFYTCSSLPIKINSRNYIFSILRYYGTNAFETKGLNAPVRFVTKQKKTSELKNLFVLALPEKWRLFGAITFLLVSSAVTMAVPFCLGKLIDIIYTSDKENMRENLNELCIILFGVFIIGALCNFCRVYLMSTTGHRITQSLRKQLYAAILRQETAMFDKHNTGEFVGRLSGDTQLVSHALTNNISDGLRSTVMSISGISMMFYASPKLAILGLAIVPPVAGLTIVMGRFLKQISRDIQDNLAMLNTIAEERISNIRTVKAFSKEISEIDHYSSQLGNVLKVCYKESLYRGIFFGLTGFSGNVIILSVLYYGGAMVADSALTIGSLSAFLMYSVYVGISLSGLSSFYSELNKALGANTRLVELIERESAIPIHGGKILDKPLSDNYDLRSLDPAWVKSQISIVSQEPILFSGTIRDNILYGVEDSTKCDIEEVAKRAHVLEFTRNMPDGLDTVVGERGITLSGGQRQRVAIARALIKVNVSLKYQSCSLNSNEKFSCLGTKNFNSG
ncbi:unnamed protein product [Xylocopa violacea]